jgi:hypothetical protein
MNTDEHRHVFANEGSAACSIRVHLCASVAMILARPGSSAAGFPPELSAAGVV